MAEQSAFLTAFDEMQKKKREQEGFSAPAPMESVVDTVGQAPAVQSPFSQAAAPNPMEAAVDPMAQTDVLAAAPAVQAPPSLVTDNPFAPSVGVSEPTVPQDVQDATERARIEDRLARINADIVASGETVGGVEKEAFKPMGGGFSFGGNTPIPADRTDSFIPVVNEILKGTGASEFENQGKAQVEALSVDPFGVTSSEIAAAGNQNFGQAVSQAQPEDPYRTQYGVNSLDQSTVDEIQQQDTEAPQAQLPSTIQNAGGKNLAGFKPKYEGQSLTDYMAGRDDPSAASVQVQDPQGRFRRQAASVAGETPEQNQARTDALFPEQADFQQASADREARQAARPDFGEAQERAAGTVTDRERRAARGDGMSDADRRDIAKANQRGASASDIARGDKVAALNGIDRNTGEPLEGGDLTFDQQLKLRSQKFNEGKFEYEITKDAKELYDTSLTEAKEAKTAEAKAESVGRGLASSVADMRDVMGRASGRLDGFFSTDMVGKAASFWKGSEADAQEADFAFLKSNVALNAMMELKANSPTGSTGFGALNTEELKVLTNQFATLDPFTDSKLVRQNLKQLNERFEGIIQNAYNTHAAEYGKEAADSVYGSMMGSKQAQGQSNQAPSGKSVTTANGRFTATAVID